MATRIATANGNFTDAATWAEVDSTSLLDAENNNTGLTTSYVESQTFAPGAITIDGIAVKVASRAASPGANTISVRLAQGGSTVAGTEVTINVSDIPNEVAAGLGWFFFKFSAPVLLVAATNYTVSAKASAASQVNLYRNATTGNWSRMIRTTTTGAPAAGDNLFVLGEWTAAATKTDRTVTMNNTSTDDFGGGSTTLTSFGIGKGGTVTWGTSASTNYRLRWSGIISIYSGGTMTMGTSGTPMPRSSTALLEFDCASDGDFGLKVYGTFTTCGLSRTSGKNVVACKMTADASAAGTSLTVDTDTGWLSGDEIAIAATSRTSSQHEAATLSGNAGASSIGLSSGLANAHSGTSPTQAEVALLTRNVMIEVVTTTAVAYITTGTASIMDCAWTSFRYLGASTSGKQGIETNQGSAGSATFTYCAFSRFERHGIYTNDAAWDNLTVDNCTFYRVGMSSTSDAAIRVSVTSVDKVNCTLTNLTIIGGDTSQGAGISLFKVNGVVINNVSVSSGAGYGLRVNTGTTNDLQKDGSISNVTAHSCGAAFRFDNCGPMTLSNLVGYRTTDSALGGVYLNNTVCGLIINGITMFGANGPNVAFETTASGSFVIRNGVFAGDSSFASTRGFINNSAALRNKIRFDNCTFGVASGIFVAHTAADIGFGTNASNRSADITLNNCVLASSTEMDNKANLLILDSALRIQRYDGTTNVHRTERRHGTTSMATDKVRNATYSLKMEPTDAGASSRLESVGVGDRGWIVPVAAGQTLTVSVYVQRNSGYNGTVQPRLMVRANPSLGIDNDTQLDVMSGPIDTWEELSGTTAAAEERGALEFYVDVAGTAGAAWVTDFSVVGS